MSLETLKRNLLMKRVVITDFVNDSLATERAIFGNAASCEALDAKCERELTGRIEDADAVMMYHTLRLSAETIARLRHCRLIVRCGVGFDNVDHAFARQRGIDVVNVPDYGTEEVADSAIGMALTLARGIHRYNASLRDGNESWTYALARPLHRLRGRVYGIVGLGRIGMATAARAKAHGMDVRFYDPLTPDGYDKAIGITRAESLQELMEQAFILSLHCPLNDQTWQLIDAETLRWLPRGSYLVNTARGGVVDAQAVVAAIADGHLAGAALDVLVDEPPLADSAVIAAWKDPRHPAHLRLILNPHAAFYCEEGFTEMRRKGAASCLRALTGKPLRNVVN